MSSQGGKQRWFFWKPCFLEFFTSCWTLRNLWYLFPLLCVREHLEKTMPMLTDHGWLGIPRRLAGILQRDGLGRKMELDFLMEHALYCQPWVWLGSYKWFLFHEKYVPVFITRKINLLKLLIILLTFFQLFMECHYIRQCSRHWGYTTQPKFSYLPKCRQVPNKGKKLR